MRFCIKSLLEETRWRIAEIKETYGIDDLELLKVYFNDINHVPNGKEKIS